MEGGFNYSLKIIILNLMEQDRVGCSESENKGKSEAVRHTPSND